MHMIALSFIFYFFCLVMFSLVSHPVCYCILLVMKALTCRFISYVVYGFSWYSLLFCLVYIGGVYILFIFISVHGPNNRVVTYWGSSRLFLAILFGAVSLSGCIVYGLSLGAECRKYLCTLSEGPFYLCVCLALLFGFVILRIIMRINLNHYR